MMRRRAGLVLLLLLSLGIGTLAWGYLEAISTPRVRIATIALADWPADAEPVKALLVSDIHVVGPDMPPERLERIVAQADALRPDLVLLAGDFTSHKDTATRIYSPAQAIAPLKKLSAPLGVIAVLGNHDHWHGPKATLRALREAGITVLINQAAKRGPLVIAGADDEYTDHADPKAMAREAARLTGPAIALSHTPDLAPALDPRFQVVLSGHTHCGQIALPLIGPLATESRYGRRYACGVVREAGRAVIITAGLGTSMLPLRIGAPPDMWLITFRGKGGPAAR